MLRRFSMPLQLIMVIGLVMLFGTYVPLEVSRMLYTISLLMREGLMLLLPLIIFFFMSTGIIGLGRGATVVVPLLLGSVVISNGVAAVCAYGVMKCMMPYVTAGTLNTVALDGGRTLAAYDIVEMVRNLLAAISGSCSTIPLLNMLVPLRPGRAMIMALVCGALVIVWPRALRWLARALECGTRVVHSGLAKGFIPFLPLFVAGFLIEMHYRQIIWDLFVHYGRTFGLLCIVQVCYIIGMYVVAAGFSLRKAWVYLRQMLPSYVTAFSTMSSTATIPVTLECSIATTGNAPFVEVATPITANVHLIGDSFATPILTLVTMYLATGMFIDFSTYMFFVGMFCQATLAAAGVPGGGIMVMIPILESFLGFTPSMVSLITTLYVLQDAFGTAANVMGDGALMIIVNKILGRLRRKKGSV